jgi:hypothetical protein
MKVRTTSGGGPSFDFVVMDSSFAAIGFPAAGAEGFDGAVCLRDRSAIDGVAQAFDDLWNRSNPLFSGSHSVDDNERARLKAEIRRRIQALSEHALPD